MNNDYEVQIEKEWEEFKKNEVYPNILLLGMTGCGKSSLINTVFGGALADVNDTTPETQRFKKFEGKNTGQNVNIIDSKGYELEHNEGLNNYVSNLKSYIDSKNGTENEIHLVWYCISVAGKRIQDMDISILKEVSNIEHIKEKMCVVLTKCDEDDEIGSVAEKFKEIVDNETGGFLRVFQVSHLKELPLELENLVCWSAEQLTDEDMRVSFVAGQKWSLELKKEEANRVINLAVVAAGAATIVPLPIATSPALVAIQFRMVMGITKVFGFQDMTSLTKGALGTVIVPAIGKQAAASLLSFIPLGSLVNVAVATAITKAMGNAIVYLCEKNAMMLLSGEEMDDFVFSVESIEKAFNFFMS